MDEIEKVVRIDVMLRHQPGERGAMAKEIGLLDPPRLPPVSAEKPGDIVRHLGVDLREEIGARRVEGVVQIEDPGADMV